MDMAANADGRRPDFVCKVYRMLQENPTLINWDNGARASCRSPRLPRIIRRRRAASAHRAIPARDSRARSSPC